jgi:hypothetical protein
MTPTLVMGGVSENDNMEVVNAPQKFRLRYVRPKPQREVGLSYTVNVSPGIQVVLRRGEKGWVAAAPELQALGHGETPEAAAADLLDRVEDYLEYLRDDKPPLAAAIAHHAPFVELLHSPRALWFASVSFDASTLG